MIRPQAVDDQHQDVQLAILAASAHVVGAATGRGEDRGTGGTGGTGLQ